MSKSNDGFFSTMQISKEEKKKLKPKWLQDLTDIHKSCDRPVKQIELQLPKLDSDGSGKVNYNNPLNDNNMLKSLTDSCESHLNTSLPTQLLSSTETEKLKIPDCNQNERQLRKKSLKDEILLKQKLDDTEGLFQSSNHGDHKHHQQTKSKTTLLKRQDSPKSYSARYGRRASTQLDSDRSQNSFNTIVDETIKILIPSQKQKHGSLTDLSTSKSWNPLHYVRPQQDSTDLQGSISDMGGEKP